jgi:sorting nexin-25
LEFPWVEPHPQERGKPSIASLGLVNTASRIGVFSDDDLFPDQERFIEDEYADPEVPEDARDPEEEIHEAAPGDLGLAEAISALTTNIEKLSAQEAVVDALTRKAELTNNTAELRILGKSKSSLRQEIRRTEMQRQQYIVQESDNTLHGRSTVQIKSIMVSKEEDGREYALCKPHLRTHVRLCLWNILTRLQTLWKYNERPATKYRLHLG